MRPLWPLLLALWLALLATAAHGEKITIAAASDLKFAMDGLVAAYSQAHPHSEVAVVYGSSGRFYAQIRQGAPYDLYFSADIDYPRQLAEAGFAAGPVTPYALGHIVLWSADMDARALTLADLAGPAITRIAIANPRHAPYGKRAEEALRASGLWGAVEEKLVFGENIAHTAQYVQSGNAQVGIIALSLALSPELSAQGGYWLVPDHLHSPLEQGFVITLRAAGNPEARAFAQFIESPPAQAILAKYGFALPTSNAETQ